MAQVDPDDDSIQRFVVTHHRYDPGRRERRPVIVAAFDNETEQWACMRRLAAEIRLRRDNGDDEARREHAAGSNYEPGYQRRAANGRLVGRAISHGVYPAGVQGLELPGSMSVLRSETAAADPDQAELSDPADPAAGRPPADR